MTRTIGVFRDRQTYNILHTILLSSPKSNVFRHGDTVWAAREGTRPTPIKTFIVNTENPQSLKDLKSLRGV